MDENRPLIRKEVITFLKSSQIPLAYGANYFQALHLEYIKQKNINENSFIKMKNQGVGLSKNMAMFKINAQAEAFFHFYSKVMGCTLQVFQKPILGIVKTDMIDNKIQQEYESSISRYHSLNSARSLKGTHYDHQTGKVHNFGVSVNLQIKDPMYRLLTESTGKVEIIDTHISILSDIVANSLNHHLEKYVLNSNFGPLNSMEAIVGYELTDNIIVAGNKSMDLKYPYPVA
ncbi:hypothetical protein GCM10007916_29470 [Psychromonas marina]|uniref:Uncharacterized protein n=1 Tax=Psychromonas marina TaxID=88364 RepID=A0ABQ6E3B9_9GAMM|nr:hypothetical protein [Psychromonas marina]GLS91877.1 hypothetical protein GCM10007916_29470 [Psychromonas marina]